MKRESIAVQDAFTVAASDEAAVECLLRIPLPLQHPSTALPCARSRARSRDAVGLAMLVYPPRIKILACDSSSRWSSDCRGPRPQDKLKCPGKPRNLRGRSSSKISSGTRMSCQTPTSMSDNGLVFWMTSGAYGRPRERLDGRSRSTNTGPPYSGRAH